MVLVLCALVVGPLPAAFAAGSGVLAVVLTPIDASDGSTITEIASGQHDNDITYRVQFSCTTAACDNTTLQFAPSAPDPGGILPAGSTLLQWTSWAAPAGASIGGTDITGKTVTLGDLPAGTSRTFTMTYTTGGDRYHDIPFGSFYPDGFLIQMAATASSDTAVAPVTGTSPPVTWHIGAPTDPAVGIGAPASVTTDTDVTYQLTMTAGNMKVLGSGSQLYGNGSVPAAGSYQVVYHAPAEATIVSAAYGGVIDNAAHTITWTAGSGAAPVYGARGGWGVNAASGYNGYGAGPDNIAGDPDSAAFWLARQVVLSFPKANFGGCNFAQDVTSSIDVSVTYLDAARTTKTASANQTNQVACWDPFGGVDTNKAVPGGYLNRYVAGDGVVSGGTYAVNVPAPGEPDRTAMGWQVRVANEGNEPAVAVIDEPTLSQPDLPVYQIIPGGVGATIDWTLDDATTGTTTLTAGQSLTAPAGRYYTSAKATTDPIAAGKIQPTDSTRTLVTVFYRFRVSSDAPIGEQRTNTAHIEVTYPGFEDEIPDQPYVSDRSRTIQFTRRTPVIGAAFDGAPVVDGGGTLSPGVGVTFAMHGATDQFWPGTTIVPQYEFIAPLGWTILPGSASAAGGAPAGVTFDYATKTIGGVGRQVVIATWPGPISPSTTGGESWPALTVRATPTASAPTGANAAVAYVRVGDASGTLSRAVSDAFATDDDQFRATPSAVADTDDVDGDGNSTENLVQATAAALTVAASSGIQVVKELCVPDASEADGCDWVADALAKHYVPANAADVTYRITVTNPGNSPLTDVVAYDVLPHVGDTSLLANPSPRGSQFDLTIGAVDPTSANVTMAYSASTNPARPEVNPGATGTVDDWGANAAGKRALRMTVDGPLAPGGFAQVVFHAAVSGSPVADQQACNSVAVDSAQTLPTEPLAVCVTLAEADLSVALASTGTLQAGRPGQFAFTVTNHGGSATAPASVAVDVPADLTVTDLEGPGWACTVDGGGSAPVAGPATLTCGPVDGAGAARTLDKGVAETLTLPVRVAADDTDPQICAGATVSGPLYDPVAGNNSDTGCRPLAAATAGLMITKDDGVSITKTGARITYTITATNTLAAETISGATITDELPASLAFVSADAGGTVSGQTVTWGLADLGPGTAAVVHVTATVTSAAASPMVNSATVTAPDPADSTATLQATGSDSDMVRNLTITKTASQPALPGVGSTVTYTVTVSNAGPGNYGAGEATFTDDLTDVLDDATGPDNLTSSSGTAVVNGNELTWSGALDAGDSAIISYDVTYSGDGDQFLANAACVPAADAAQGTDGCALVTVPAGKLRQWKTVQASGTPVMAGTVLTYTLHFENAGQAAAAVDVTDDLTDVLDDAEVTAEPSGPAGLTATRTGASISVVGSVPVGQTYLVTYQVTVKPDGQRGDDIAANYLGRAAPADPDCTPTDPDSPDCTRTPIGGLAATKSVSASADPVVAGTVLTYTLTFASTGQGPVTVDQSDLLADVLDDASITSVAAPSDPALSAARSGDVLGVTGTLGVDQTVTVTYQVTVNDESDRGNDTVTNYLVPRGTRPPVGCDADQLTCTSTPLPNIAPTKTADPESGSSVDAGQQVTYTLTFRNTGTAAGPVDYTDDLSGVLDDATVSAAPKVSDPALTASDVVDGKVHVTGTLQVDQVVTIVYTATVNPATQRGDNELLNILYDPAQGDPPTGCADGNGMCTVHHAARITSGKTVDPGTGTVVRPGQKLVYTLAFGNTGTGSGTVDAVDDLGHVTDDAAVTTEPIASDPALTATRSGDRIVVHGALAAGQTVTVTYTVTVNPETDRGDGVLANYLLEPGQGAPADPVCTPPSGSAATCTRNPVLAQQPALDLVKSASPGTVAAAGDIVSYSFLITNTGNVTLTGVHPVEGSFSGTGRLSAIDCPDGAASLVPGRSVTCTATYSVTAADLVAGTLSNSARATGTAPQGDPVTSPGSQVDVAVDLPPTTPSSTTPSTTATSATPTPTTTTLSPSADPQQDSQPPLSYTGTNTALHLGLAALLLVAGGALLVLAGWRRRRDC